MNRQADLLTFDPSITATGYAVFAGPGELDEAGLIKPDSPGAPAAERIWELYLQVSELVVIKQPRRIVIEIPTAHVSRGRPGAGLTTYGMAAGAVWCAARRAMHDLARDAVNGAPAVVAYDERTWTGCRPKRLRIRRIAVSWPQYDAAADPGGDVADAIGLGAFDYRKRQAGSLSHNNAGGGK